MGEEEEELNCDVDEGDYETNIIEDYYRKEAFKDSSSMIRIRTTIKLIAKRPKKITKYTIILSTEQTTKKLLN